MKVFRIRLLIAIITRKPIFLKPGMQYRTASGWKFIFSADPKARVAELENEIGRYHDSRDRRIYLLVAEKNYLERIIALRAQNT